MRATEILIEEHVMIKQVLNSLSRAKEYIENGKLPSKSFFEKAIRFSHDFSDKFHHFKEEFLMFGILAQKKKGYLDWEIGALRYQHERCRKCIKEIEAAVNGNIEENEILTTTLLENIAMYISILQRHIYQEDNVFLPMVEKLLPEEEKQFILEQFSKEEDRIGGKNMYESCKKLADELAAMIEDENILIEKT